MYIIKTSQTIHTHLKERKKGPVIVLFLRVARVVWDTQKKERKKGPIVVLFLRVARVTWG